MLYTTVCPSILCARYDSTEVEVVVVVRHVLPTRHGTYKVLRSNNIFGLRTYCDQGRHSFSSKHCLQTVPQLAHTFLEVRYLRTLVFPQQVFAASNFRRLLPGFEKSGFGEKRFGFCNPKSARRNRAREGMRVAVLAVVCTAFYVRINMKLEAVIESMTSGEVLIRDMQDAQRALRHDVAEHFDHIRNLAAQLESSCQRNQALHSGSSMEKLMNDKLSELKVQQHAMMDSVSVIERSAEIRLNDAKQSFQEKALEWVSTLDQRLATLKEAYEHVKPLRVEGQPVIPHSGQPTNCGPQQQLQ